MSFRAVPTDWSEWRGAVRRIAQAVNLLAEGRSNGFGSVTLAANQDSTTVTDARVGTDSVISLMPTSVLAGQEIGAGTLYVDPVTAGSFTINHANNAQTDRTFTYSVQG